MADKYYAMIHGGQKGPFSLEELPAAGVRPSTYIWCKGMPDWQKAEENPEVCRLFRNHLYDIMHPLASAEAAEIPKATDDKWKVKPDEPSGPPRSRFDGFLEQAGEDPLPTIDEIEAKKDTSTPPMSMIGYAWLVTIFCCPPTGIVALVFAYRSKKAWKSGEYTLSHEFSRKAKMWTGVSFFLGLMAYGFLIALSM